MFFNNISNNIKTYCNYGHKFFHYNHKIRLKIYKSHDTKKKYGTINLFTCFYIFKLVNDDFDSPNLLCHDDILELSSNN